MSEINVTPLIDLAFALLIIFMITAPLLTQSIEINPPRASAQPGASEVTLQEITIDERGQHYWGDEPVSLDELGLRLELLAAEPEPPVVRIRADATLPYQQVVDVLDLARQQNLTKISLETRAP